MPLPKAAAIATWRSNPNILLNKVAIATIVAMFSSDRLVDGDSCISGMRSSSLPAKIGDIPYSLDFLDFEKCSIKIALRLKSKFLRLHPAGV